MSKIVLLPGDGIGPEVTAEAQACLALLSVRCDLDLEFETHDFGGAGIDNHGTPLPEATLAACREADAILLGAVGGPRWDGAKERPEAGLLGLRSELGLFANLRPGGAIPGLEELSPLKPEIAKGADILVVRELTGGADAYHYVAAKGSCAPHEGRHGRRIEAATGTGAGRAN